MNSTKKEIKLSDIEKAVKDLNIPTVENLGNGLYKLPEGIITNEKGLEQFNKMILKDIKHKRNLL